MGNRENSVTPSKALIHANDGMTATQVSREVIRMDWAGKSNPALVEAILATFRDRPEQVRQNLLSFTPRDWVDTRLWIHTSGMALYFLDRVSAKGISGSIDSNILRSLEQKYADNKIRTSDMLQEFVAINRSFATASICYANLKGFTLSPDSCADLSLRHQSDFDFLIDPADLNRGRFLLEERGYVVTGSTARTLELKSGHSQKISIEEHYKAKPLRSVELHTTIDVTNSIGVRDERLNRLSEWVCEAGSFPALSSADQLIGQALHIVGHLRGEHTRPSWLLEYRHHVSVRRGDRDFWQQVRSLAARDPNAVIALGLVTMLATEIFGAFSFPELDSWTVDVLPLGVMLWATHYGRRAMLADVPGTKLYLLLDTVLAERPPLQERARKLIPLHCPPRILRAPPKDSIRLRVRREIVQLRFILHRLHFHFKHGVIHLIEARRWNKLLERSGDCVTSRFGERRSQDKDIAMTSSQRQPPNVEL
jgi:hypothetical protein